MTFVLGRCAMSCILPAHAASIEPNWAEQGYKCITCAWAPNGTCDADSWFQVMSNQYGKRPKSGHATSSQLRATKRLPLWQVNAKTKRISRHHKSKQQSKSLARLLLKTATANKTLITEPRQTKRGEHRQVSRRTSGQKYEDNQHRKNADHTGTRQGRRGRRNVGNIGEHRQTARQLRQEKGQMERS